MNWFLDTSVLFPVFLADHPHHRDSLSLYKRCSPETACCSAHSLAEVYSTFTRIPPPHRVSPEQAIAFLEDIHTHLRLISLEGGDYLDLIREAAYSRIAGGTIYDAVIARCAKRAEAEVLYTWNERHFQLLGPDVVRRLKTPLAQV